MLVWVIYKKKKKKKQKNTNRIRKTKRYDADEDEEDEEEEEEEDGDVGGVPLGIFAFILVASNDDAERQINLGGGPPGGGHRTKLQKGSKQAHDSPHRRGKDISGTKAKIVRKTKQPPFSTTTMTTTTTIPRQPRHSHSCRWCVARLLTGA
ncbi:hypothetical protein M0804_009275 [Polistes exclamans]|nr:hypothetical protein M0804_009275 [Polistes exclamans]